MFSKFKSALYNAVGVEGNENIGNVEVIQDAQKSTIAAAKTASEKVSH